MTGRLEKVLDQIDEINKLDPNLEVVNDTKIPKELIYGKRMSVALNHYFPNSSELLQIATRGQHIKRWAIPRNDYPMDRKGYLKWRTQLKIFHGELLADIMNKSGYHGNDIEQIKDLLMKKNLKTNLETQILEDVICLVFLEHYIEEFARNKTEEKLISIINKTWTKMSEKGHEFALQLSYSSSTYSLIKKALSL